MNIVHSTVMSSVLASLNFMEYAGGAWYSAFAVSAKNSAPFCAYHLPEVYPSYR